MGKGGESATEDDEDWDDDDLWSYIEYYLTIIQLINLYKGCEVMIYLSYIG